MQGDIKKQERSKEQLTPASFSHRTEEVPERDHLGIDRNKTDEDKLACYADNFLLIGATYGDIHLE